MTIMRNFPEAIKLKCEYDLDYIIKYVSCKKISNCNYKFYVGGRYKHQTSNLLQ